MRAGRILFLAGQTALTFACAQPSRLVDVSDANYHVSVEDSESGGVELLLTLDRLDFGCPTLEEDVRATANGIPFTNRHLGGSSFGDGCQPPAFSGVFEPTTGPVALELADDTASLTMVVPELLAERSVQLLAPTADEPDGVVLVRPGDEVVFAWLPASDELPSGSTINFGASVSSDGTLRGAPLASADVTKNDDTYAAVLPAVASASVVEGALVLLLGYYADDSVGVAVDLCEGVTSCGARVHPRRSMLRWDATLDSRPSPE